MQKRIHRFLNLSMPEKLLFMEAFYRLAVMKRAIDTKPLKEITQGLHYHEGYIVHTIKNQNQYHKATAVTIGNIIQKASRHTPWQSACLVQSLALVEMLKKRSIPAMFYLGVNMADEMKAHAWSIYDNEILTGKNGYEKFTVVSSVEFVPGEEL